MARKRQKCWYCADYQVVGVEGDGIIRAYQKPVEVSLVPAYVNKKNEVGRRTWVRVGFYCPRCQRFYEHDFKRWK